LELWVEDTKDMSIAHLRELVAAVYCLGQEYEDVLERLKAMSVQLKGEEGFKQNKLGFNKAGPRPMASQNFGVSTGGLFS
jgi:hypothetical protein